MLALLPAAFASSYTVVLSGPDATEDATIGAYADNDWPITEDGLELYGSAYDSYDRRAVLAFPSLIGDAAGQVPLGSTLTAATLTLTVWDYEGDVAHVGLWTLGEAFTEDADWDFRTATDKWSTAGAGSASRVEGCGQVTYSDGQPGTLIFDVAPCVDAWASGAVVNAGWVVGDQGTYAREEDIYFWAESSESDYNPPVLTVSFVAPDRDGDGADLWEDCDDADAARAPTLAEVCGDGVDQDCDGADASCDGDTASPADTGAGGDHDLDRFDVAEGDCDDADPAVHPGRADDDCDGVDSDCDGAVDEDCAVTAGGTGCSCGEPDPGMALLLLPALWRRRRGDVRGP